MKERQQAGWHNIHFYRPIVKDENFITLIDNLKVAKDVALPGMTIFDKELEITTLSQRQVSFPSRLRPDWASRPAEDIRMALKKNNPASVLAPLVLDAVGVQTISNNRGKTFLSVDFGNRNTAVDEHLHYVEMVTAESGVEVFAKDFPGKMTIGFHDRRIPQYVIAALSQALPKQFVFGPVVFD